ncbi:ABC transporter permease [Deinococcus maricopensis]|uniref:ABC-type transporter, integral membrane subunit n=1 Tax=Deinococcus maricopensis (strain DSM 21211 / LMG 22137 / NRRL B-23946 / LB-34) TaxID=709986 RepID=E8U482_DEIML|nr:ABC transporter permease [Deinococcus maricopensis]ADV65919.1 ABC-type transporter, integral membrane subunit [Deinococcus maricopensis DSM 21211]
MALNMPAARAFPLRFLGGQGALIALVLLVGFAALRYDGFLSAYNISSFFRYNAMFMLIAIGMTFVIVTGGIDLSVGSVAAMASVMAALASPFGPLAGLLAGVVAGALVGLLNGIVITRLRVEPFIATLGTFLGARGVAQLASNQSAVSVDANGTFVRIGQGDWWGVPIPVVLTLAVFLVGFVLLRSTRFGRSALSIGDNEDAARLMGFNVGRVKLLVYVISGTLAGLAGVILASQFGAGQPTEGVGWELTAIAGVVVGGTLLTGGRGSLFNTVVGVTLLGLIFNVLNFENGKGIISIDVFWQNVIRGVFLLVVVVVQSSASRRRV